MTGNLNCSLLNRIYSYQFRNLSLCTTFFPGTFGHLLTYALLIFGKFEKKQYTISTTFAVSSP